MIKLSGFMMDIRHVEGKANVVADSLSRAPVNAMYLGIDFKRMAADQHTDPEVRTVRVSNTSLKLKDVPMGT